ncbi:lipase [Magnaporthiopsis poae ATCC 64411]|uniref:1-alkyl-2-acetylglycerophosphocholine esterase n=1 Tax=Magnaporthiopsis poae (strain ATCC 64411 / 73-15) TaxID=644358 RepID=A0A0C4DKA2_MAGP6|nr:lipase [Magnaporthiopsis poae ATCC 64411]
MLIDVNTGSVQVSHAIPLCWPGTMPSLRLFSSARLVLTALALQTAAIASLQPLIPPTGPFNVGISKHAIPFVNPDDPFAPGNVTTSYLATVFYPTLDEPPCPATPYLHPEIVRIYGTHYGLPLPKLRALTAPVRWGANPAPADKVATLTGRNYSTLIWGAGGTGSPPEANTMLLSDLASRGYAVVGIEHPYEQPFVWYPNPNPNIPGGGGPTDPGPGIVGTPTDIQLTEPLLRQLYAVRLREMLHVTKVWWPAIVAEKRWPFATSGMGIMGHSFGGSLALDVAAKTPANLTAAAINLDGLIWSPNQDAGKPQMLFGSYLHIPGPETIDATWGEYSRLQTEWWRWTLAEDYGHLDCSDVALWKELGPHNMSNFSVAGIPGDRAVEITRGLVNAFFDRFVRGIPDEKGVLDSPGKVYKEVQLIAGDNGSNSTTA